MKARIAMLAIGAAATVALSWSPAFAITVALATIGLFVLDVRVQRRNADSDRLTVDLRRR
jgi:hypothetical protein